ncbi:MAG TPA: hemolysin family protein [Solirubrobacteraceae bacterium]|nr:hemolysin family protein [Solirubrobacteraceae bacterium]
MTALGILGVLALVMANAFFVIAEYALVTAPRGRVQEMADDGSGGARVALTLMDDPVRFIGTVQVGITALGIALGALGEPVFREVFDPLVAAWISFALSFAIITYLSVVLGELVPKALALHRAAPVAALVARPIALLQRIISPLVWVLQGSARLVLRPLGVPAAPAGATVHTVDELRGIVAEAEDSGLIEEAEEEMLYRVFDFAGQEAADVMVPSSEVVTLDGSLSVRDAVERALQAPHSRFPVVRGSIDDVAGVLALRDLTTALHAGDQRTIDKLARDLLVVPETKDVGALLQEMRKGGAQMALVVGEYGRTMGIVTLNDLVEEIVGEIEEEYGLPDEAVQELPDGRLRVSGSFTCDDFNETFHTDLPTEDYRTLGGLVFGELGRAPRRGDGVTVAGVELGVEEIDGPRIAKLLVRLPAAPGTA